VLKNEVHATLNGRLCHLWRPEAILMPSFVTFDGDEEELRNYQEYARHGLYALSEDERTVGITLLGFWFSSLSTLN
jgi:hypothetical protein